MTMKKLHICENLYEKLGLPRRECGDIVEKFFKVVKESLANGDDVMLTGFGTLMVKHKKARRGRNPHTGEDMELAERRIVTFKLSQVLKKKINRRKK